MSLISQLLLAFIRLIISITLVVLNYEKRISNTHL